MKRLLPLIILISLSMEGFSQNGTFGVRGGLNISHLEMDAVPANAMNKHRNINTMTA